MERPHDYPVHTLIAERWSPVDFDAETRLSEQQMRSLFEAARLSPSCMNEQPWTFIYALKQDREDFDRLLSCLTGKNREWAENAGALIISAAKLHFDHKNRVNNYAKHDTGLATSLLLIQAVSMGFFVHPMAGFDKDKAHELLNIPETHEPVAAMAAGFLSEEGLRIQDRTPRHPQTDFVYQGSFSKSV